MSKKILAIVVTYNGLKWYQQCFSSLQNSSIPVDIFVVDNASSDGTDEFISRNFNNIIYLKLKKNIGFGQANNIGLQYAIENGYGYAFLLNQDAWIENDTIKLLIEVQTRNSNYGILSPIHLNKSKTSFESNFKFFITPQWGCNDFISDLYLKKLKDVYVTSFVNAACWLISRDCLLKVGYFDPMFFHYGEDDNYVYRAIYHSFKVGISPNSCIVHDTENRIVAKKFLDGERQKNLLGHFCDVRSNEYKRIPHFVMSFWFKSLLLLLKFKIKKSKMHFLDGLFLLKNRAAIIQSVTTNRNVFISA
jgi:GT2 family glycosyltransferase